LAVIELLVASKALVLDSSMDYTLFVGELFGSCTLVFGTPNLLGCMTEDADTLHGSPNEVSLDEYLGYAKRAQCLSFDNAPI
jgi:hypothetical protein